MASPTKIFCLIASCLLISTQLASANPAATRQSPAAVVQSAPPPAPVVPGLPKISGSSSTVSFGHDGPKSSSGNIGAPSSASTAADAATVAAEEAVSETIAANVAAAAATSAANNAVNAANAANAAANAVNSATNSAAAAAANSAVGNSGPGFAGPVFGNGPLGRPLMIPYGPPFLPGRIGPHGHVGPLGPFGPGGPLVPLGPAGLFGPHGLNGPWVHPSRPIGAVPYVGY